MTELGAAGAAEGFDWECIVVGGGAAGLSAALVLGRARRRTLMVDAGAPSNLAAEGVGGLLGHDGRSPAELYRKGRQELAAYPSVELRAGEVVSGEAIGGGLRLELADGTEQSASQVLLATGMDYRYPSVPGAEERWGHSVFHCPFCHGWEVRGRPLAVLDTGPMAMHRVLLVRAWSDEVTLLRNGAGPPDAADAERLQAAGVRIEGKAVAGLRGEGRELRAIAFEGGEELDCGGLLVGTTLHQRSDLPARLGARLTEPGPVVVDGVIVDDSFESSVPGLYAAGDTLPKPPAIQHAIFSGSGAAAKMVGALTS